MQKRLGKRRPLYELIVSEVERMVLAGEFKPGEFLPPESELAQRFGVSRTAVREAVKVLSQKRLVAALHGKGLVVVHPSSATLTDSLSLLLKIGGATPIELTEVRRFLEPQLATLAAIRATSEQMQALEELAAAYSESLDEPRRAVSCDVEFHRTISEAAGNRVVKAIVDSIQESFFESMMYDYRVEGALERATLSHRQICSAVKSRDGEAARRYMQEHLDNVLRDQLAVADRSSKGA